MKKLYITCIFIIFVIIVGYFYFQGKEAQIIDKRNFEDKTKLCESDAASCSDLAYMYYSGIGVDKDKQKAFFYNKKACDGGEYKNCSFVASAYYKGDGVVYDYTKALEYSILACEKGDDSYSCGMCGYFYSIGKGTRKDREKANFYNKKACDMGNEKSCQYVK